MPQLFCRAKRSFRKLAEEDCQPADIQSADQGG
jgi:hypothetical protein